MTGRPLGVGLDSLGGEEGMEGGSHISPGMGFGTPENPRVTTSLEAALLAGSFPETGSGIFSK